MGKVYQDAASALDGLLFDDISVAAGGFGLCGIPENLIQAIKDSGIKNMTIASNNAGVGDFGLGLLLQDKQVKKMISSYVGENDLFMQQYLAGTLEIEFNPQGTLAERLRAGGAGIPGFYTATGVGTQIAEGKETKEFDGRTYVLERGLRMDLAVVKAWKGDAQGNLTYRKTAMNFNPECATAGKVTVADYSGGVSFSTGKYEGKRFDSASFVACDPVVYSSGLVKVGSVYPHGRGCTPNGRGRIRADLSR